MREITKEVTFGCLLHDIGKPIYRAGQEVGTHSQAGYSWLKKTETYQDQTGILDCVRWHHAHEIRDASPNEDNICYIAYIADNIASAADRRKTGEAGFQRTLPLQPVFLHMNGEHPGYTLPFGPVDGVLRLPIKGEQQEVTGSDYCTPVEGLRKELNALPPEDAWLNSLLAVLETWTSTMPASTNTGESPDISLFDHLKVTAAAGACICEYLLAGNRTNFKEELFDKEKSFRSEKAFRLYSADLSGIQNFLYTVSTTNALRSLRSRSFFMELIMEHYIDELLTACGLSRANLLYSGGGHCYILLPNTKQAMEAAEGWNRKFNHWLADTFGISLYLADGSTACSADDLTNEPKEFSPYRGMFRRVSAEIAEKKNHRYTADEIRGLNESAAAAEGRECRVCGRSDSLQKADDGSELCPWCALFESLSGNIQKKNIVLVTKESLPGCSFALPSQEGQAFYSFTDVDTARTFMREDDGIIRVYSKNRFYAGLDYSTVLYVGDYASSNNLEDLADASDGVPRLGICRMDVDDLGQAFVSGFESKDADPEEHGKYVTLSRTAAFSRQMSLFFKGYINSVLSGEFGHKQPLNVSIVYSGGDDVFLLGAWDDTVAAAVRIRDAFRHYSCHSLSISAGLAVTDHNYPVRLSAGLAAELEDEAKARPGKNSLALFESGGLHCFDWVEFSEDVLGTKKRALEEFFGIKGNERGMAFLYRLMELLRDTQLNPERKLNLARYAYLLARLEPKGKDAAAAYRKFADRMYEWSLDAENRRRLITAIYLWVYENRKRK